MRFGVASNLALRNVNRRIVFAECVVGHGNFAATEVGDTVLCLTDGRQVMVVWAFVCIAAPGVSQRDRLLTRVGRDNLELMVAFNGHVGATVRRNGNRFSIC